MSSPCPHAAPSSCLHAAPASYPHAAPASYAHAAPASYPHAAPASFPHAAPASCPHAAPASYAHAAPASCPHSAPASCPHAAPASCPHAAPAPPLPCQCVVVQSYQPPSLASALPCKAFNTPPPCQCAVVRSFHPPYPVPVRRFTNRASHACFWGLGRRGEGERVGELPIAPAAASAHLPPFGAVVERSQQLHERVLCQRQRRPPADLRDLAQRRQCVGHHHRVGVAQHVAQRLEEATVIDLRKEGVMGVVVVWRQGGVVVWGRGLDTQRRISRMARSLTSFGIMTSSSDGHAG
eukprot:27543-Chlamydomonas_euryale.AAC.1